MSFQLTTLQLVAVQQQQRNIIIDMGTSNNKQYTKKPQHHNTLFTLPLPHMPHMYLLFYAHIIQYRYNMFSVAVTVSTTHNNISYTTLKAHR